HIASGTALVPCRFAVFEQGTIWEDELGKNPWLTKEQLVVKPDQLIKRRGKLGLVGVNKTAAEVRRWLSEHTNKDQKVGAASGKLRRFVVEPFVKHEPVSEIFPSLSTSYRRRRIRVMIPSPSLSNSCSNRQVRNHQLKYFCDYKKVGSASG
ncbi:jg15131, partial [Pararge aegeria aegeria]